MTKILGMEFRTEPLYLLHLALIIFSIYGTSRWLNISVGFFDSLINVLILYLVIYISDNVWRDRLGV